jgi:uncharacterized protein with FMN-binding domain
MVHNMSQTKIVVIHLKEIIYTALFAGLGILLIILLVAMFLNKKEDTQPTISESKYVPGVYTSSMVLNDTALNLEVVVDDNHVNSVRIVNIDDSITTMYPLIEPSLETISEELCNGVDIDSIEVSEDSKYTETLLLETIKATLEKAEVANEE